MPSTSEPVVPSHEASGDQDNSCLSSSLSQEAQYNELEGVGSRPQRKKRMPARFTNQIQRNYCDDVMS